MMSKEAALEILKKAILAKQDGMKFSIEMDAKMIAQELILVVMEEFVKDSANPYDDKLLEMLKPFIEAKLA